MRNVVVLTLAALMAASPAAAQDRALAARIARVENGLTTPVVVAGRTDQGTPILARMRATNTPAVSIAVINNGRIEWARAYGVLEAGGTARADTGTLFQAGSTSKPVSVLGALMLVERGRLSLDADVNNFLRSWRVPENAFTARERVTLRRLASHSAGVTVTRFPGYAMTASVPTTLQVLDGQAPATTPPIRVDTFPGAMLRFSGGGYVVMQQMVEDVSGQPFAAFMRQTVLQPLGMRHSSFEHDVPADRAGRVARGHTQQGAPVAGGWNRFPEMAAAGLWTTPSDLARFHIAMHRASRGETVGPLTPAVAQAMLNLERGQNGSGFGLGMQLDAIGTTAGWFGHAGGANAGYRSQTVMFPGTGQGAVVMTSSDAGNEVVFEILRSLAREYGWPAMRPVEKAAVALDPAALRDFPGRYAGQLQGQPLEYEVTAANGVLSVGTRTWPAPRVMYPMSESRFFLRESEREYVFDRDASGRVVRMRVVGAGSPEVVAERVP